MSNPPKGYWKCPNCGGFVEDYYGAICPDCGYKKLNEEREKTIASRSAVKTSESNQSDKSRKEGLHFNTDYINSPNITGIIASDYPSDCHEPLCTFFTLFAWLTWIGGAIVSFFLGRTPEYSTYYTTRIIDYEYNIPLMAGCFFAFLLSGAILLAISKALQYLAQIAANTGAKKISLTKKP